MVPRLVRVEGARTPRNQRENNMRYDQALAFAEVPQDDDLCHCGRLARFKNCCKQYDFVSQVDRINRMTLSERSRVTVEAVRHFLFGGSSRDLLSTENFTPDRAAQFYRFISDVWPHRLRALDALRQLQQADTLTGYYVGDPRPETIIHNIARLSLYTDRIFVEQPFYLPWAVQEEYDPVLHPDQVMQDTRKWAVVTMLLQPWIDAGLVVYIPDPSDFDHAVKDAFLAAGKKREREGKIAVAPEDLKQSEGFLKADFLRQFYALPDDEIIERMRRSIDLKDDAIPGVLDYVHDQRRMDPLFVPGIGSDILGSDILMRLQIPTLEQTVLSCGLTNAFPFTDVRGKWREISEAINALPPDAEVWSPLTRAFAECKLEFLNIEDARLAFQIRNDGHLSSFRVFMRDLWRAIDGVPDERVATLLARDMSDRLRHEHEVAEQEWKTIHNRYDRAVRSSGMKWAVAGVTGALTQIGLLSVALSFAAHAFFANLEGERLREEIASLKVRIPMAILIDASSAS